MGLLPELYRTGAHGKRLCAPVKKVVDGPAKLW